MQVKDKKVTYLPFLVNFCNSCESETVKSVNDTILHHFIM